MEHYIMVTDFSDHWRNNQITKFPVGMLEPELRGKTQKMIDKQAQNNVVFVKINNSGVIQDVHQGYIIPRSVENNLFYFRVLLTEKINDHQRYNNYAESGMYINRIDAPNNQQQTATNKLFEPPLINRLKQTTDHVEFEHNVFYLLKLMGINDLHQHPMENQQGKADGFFKIGNNAVIYDATLSEKFQTVKAKQIENYINQLQSNSKLSFGHVGYTLKDTNKMVWVITKGESRIIKEVDQVIVCEVAIDDLIALYHRRLTDNLTELKLKDAIYNMAGRL